MRLRPRSFSQADQGAVRARIGAMRRAEAAWRAGLRPQEPLSAVAETVRERHRFDLGVMRVRAGLSRGHLIEVVFNSPEFASTFDERAEAAADLATRSLLGDERYETWIGAVGVAPMPRQGPLRVLAPDPASETFAPSELYAAVDAASRGVLDGLSDSPWHAGCDRGRWTMLELDPRPSGGDYCAQDDLALATTLMPEMLKCFLQGSPFSSNRFTKNAETFCYVKTEIAGSMTERQEVRISLEDLLNDGLVARKAGCVVGSGLGLRYTYIDLALTDLDAGAALAMDGLRSRHAAPRTWILFCDTRWQREWLGAWNHSPAPPA